jgi:hypothetical protein
MDRTGRSQLEISVSRWRVLIVLLAAVLVLAVGVSSAVAAQSHAFIRSFGSPGTGAGQFDLTSESGLAVNQSNGDLYVADTGNHRVEKFDPTGKFLFAFGWGVKSGDTASAGLDTCTEAAGCQAGFPGHAPAQFEEPTFIAVDNTPGGNGDVYVANRGAVGNERQTVTLSGATSGTYTLSFTDVIHGTTTNGSRLITGVWGPSYYLTIGEAISGPGIPVGTTVVGKQPETLELSASATASATSVALGVTGTSSKIAAAAPAYGSGSVQETLEHLEVLKGFEGNIAVSGSAGGPYTIEFTDQLAGTNIRQMSCDGSGLTPVGATCAAATAVDGFNANRVQKFDSSGNLIAGWGGSPAGGELDGTTCSMCGSRPHFEHLSGVVVIPPLPLVPVKPKGSLLVLDLNQATEWTQSSGEFVYRPGTAGVGAPIGMAVDPADHVYLGNGGFEHPPYEVIQTSYCNKEDPFGPCPGSNTGEGYGYHKNCPVDPGPATGVAVDPSSEDVYVARFEPSSHHSDVAVYDSLCNHLETFGGNGDEITQSAGIAASGFSGSQSDVYVADEAVNRVDFFAPGGPRDALTVTRAGSGLGSVTSQPAGIACPSICATGFPAGEVVTLTASAPEHSSFIGWSGGGCGGTGSCRITLTAAAAVTATFAQDRSTIVAGGAFAVTRHTATLTGMVDPEGDASSCFFEYGLTSAYGAVVPCASHPGSGASPVAVSAGLWDLVAGSVYHDRLVSANTGGVSYGPDITFTTLPDSCASNTALCPVSPAAPLLANEGLVFLSKQSVGTTTSAQKLVRALKACKRQKRKSPRVSCERQARKRYAPVRRTKKSTHSRRRGGLTR